MITEAQLNTVFNAARNTKPLISQEEITWFIRYGIPEKRIMKQPVVRLYPAIAFTVLFCAALSYWMFVQDRIWSPLQAPKAQQEYVSSDSRTAPSTGIIAQSKQNPASRPDAPGETTLKTTTPNNALYVSAPQFNVSFVSWVRKTIDPVQPHQLSSDELKKLGIEISAAGEVLINYSGHPLSIRLDQDGRLWWGFERKKFNQVSVEKYKKVGFKPVLMTDTKGKLVRETFLYDSLACKNSERVNRFIPIEITLAGGVGARPAKYVLWFDRTREVLRSLPARIRKALGSTEFQSDARYAAEGRTEYKINNIEIDADKTFAQVKTLAAMNTRSAFTIYDIQGQKLESRGTDDPFKPADVSLSFAKLEPGIYQLALQTDAGLPLVQRVVVTVRD
jgi:hypothetical protein